jgi:hypothetical protein
VFCLFVVDARAIFSYLAAVTITGDRIANLDVFLALMAFNNEGFLRATPTAGTSIFKVISERPVILTSECCAFGEGAIPTYFNVLDFDAAARAGVLAHDLPDAKREHYH